MRKLGASSFNRTSPKLTHGAKQKYKKGSEFIAPLSFSDRLQDYLAAFFNAEALSVFSHVKFLPSRPKWPKAAVAR